MKKILKIKKKLYIIKNFVLYLVQSTVYAVCSILALFLAGLLWFQKSFFGLVYLGGFFTNKSTENGKNMVGILLKTIERKSFLRIW